MLRMGGMGRLSEDSGHIVAAIAERAVSIGSLEELELLSRAVSLIESGRIRSNKELDALLGCGHADAAVASYARSARLLPDMAPPAQARRPASRCGLREGNRRYEGSPNRVDGRVVVQQSRRHDDRRDDR